MRIDCLDFDSDFDLTNGLKTLYNNGYSILIDRIVIPEKDYTDCIYILFHPQKKQWAFPRIKSEKPNPDVEDFFGNINIVSTSNEKKEPFSVSFVNNKKNNNKITLSPYQYITNGIKIEADINSNFIENINLSIGYNNRRQKTSEYFSFLSILERNSESSIVTAPLLLSELIEKEIGIDITSRTFSIRKIMLSLTDIRGHFQTLKRIAFLISNNGLESKITETINNLNNLIELYSRNKLFPNFITIGGVRRDFSKEWIAAAKEAIKDIQTKVKIIERTILNSNSFRSITKDTGKISKQEALKYGLNGYILRASGIDITFNNLIQTTVLGRTGSNWDRFFVRIEDIKRHNKEVLSRLDDLQDEPTNNFYNQSVFSKNKDTVEGQINNFMTSLEPLRLKAGDFFEITESYQGLSYIFLRSKNDTKPYFVTTGNGIKSNLLAYKKALLQDTRSMDFFITVLGINGLDITGSFYEE